MDGACMDILKCGSENLPQHLTYSKRPQLKRMSQMIWTMERQEGWLWGLLWGTSVPSVVGKVFCRIMSNRLLYNIANDVFHESQCDFINGRVEVGGQWIWSLLFNNFQKNTLRMFTKAFGTVNRNTLWNIRRKLGCPDMLISVLRCFHDGMTVGVNMSGKLSDPVLAENGFKQGDISMPTLSSLSFTIGQASIRAGFLSR